MFKNLKDDLPASLVVYLVALPLCLGIAIASDAPLFSGMIAGIIGGIVVGSLSGSQISVSGPAAGLAVIVASDIKNLGELVARDKMAALDGVISYGFENAFELFLLSVVIAGVFQFILGLLKAGRVGNYIPSSVIKGMLAAIGLLLILKQIPHALGVDTDFEGDEAFIQEDGENTLTEMWHALLDFSPGALIISLIAGAIILIWGRKSLKRYSLFKYVPGALVAVILGALLNAAFGHWKPEWQLAGDHLVRLPLDSIEGNPQKLITLPDWRGFQLPLVWKIAGVIAIIASLETLLSLEASDKLDPLRRISPPNRELKAQGVGNIVSGLIGGLPITAVIVRSSANVMAGAQSRLSSILHGVFLLVSVLLFPQFLNLIPKSALAVVLILVGYKLISWEVIVENYKKGINQFIPFAVTIVAIMLTDLLKGIGIGLLVGIIFIIRTNFSRGVTFIIEGENVLIKLRDNVSYLNKGYIRRELEKLPSGASVLIDGGSAHFIDPDIYELIDDFIRMAKDKQIEIEIKRTLNSHNALFKVDGRKFDSE